MGSDVATPGNRVQGEQSGNFKGKILILHSTNLKLLRKLQGNLINDCDLFKLIIFGRGGHSNYLPHVP
jgi:hypothetical protein